jgi:hypothetical protein
LIPHLYGDAPWSNFIPWQNLQPVQGISIALFGLAPRNHKPQGIDRRTKSMEQTIHDHHHDGIDWKRCFSCRFTIAAVQAKEKK